MLGVNETARNTTEMSSIVSQIENIEEKVVVCKKRLDRIDQSLRHDKVTDDERNNLVNEENMIKEEIGQHETELKSLRAENRKNTLISVAVFALIYIVYALFWRTS